MENGYTKNKDGSFTDSYGRIWCLTESQLCPVCGQPDDYSDCNHKRLTDNEYDELKYGDE